MPRKRHHKKQGADLLAGLTTAEVAAYLLDPKRLTTPDAIDDHVRDFCDQVSHGETPVFLTPNPQPWSRYRFCNRNIERMIELHGGAMLLGYRLWYVQSLYIEAERHAVWKSLDERLVDISFYPDGEKRILFLPAPGLDTVVLDPHLKPRAGFCPEVGKFIRWQQMQEREAQLQYDDSWQAWKEALSYENWLRRNRQLHPA